MEIRVAVIRFHGIAIKPGRAFTLHRKLSERKTGRYISGETEVEKRQGGRKRESKSINLQIKT